ncbi:sensor histidine kinase [Clostridium sp. AF19-22AC]|jgi:signal transduction histidine kinase|uniref:sensor histidine kinase n=1 Tax=Clostridia TaxID=186801 RepID=UPI000E4E5676|nr:MULTISPECIES: HAMP domain-containing sensor histidine kinase [Clostridia]RHR32034.1 sensor histidine kinase [Clostridium sp. AF19-22AC]
MIYLILAVVCFIAMYFCIRFFLLKKALGEAAQELREITEDLEENRIVKLPSPQAEMEVLLEEVNRNLEEIRRIHVGYQEKEQMLQSQIENISHDLRTPLTSILGFLDLIDESSLKVEDRDSLEIVRKKARSMKRLTAQFYDLSRLTAGDYELEVGKADAGRILRETTLESYQELVRKNLDVRLDIPDEAVFALADEAALERIFSNLIQNALRYAVSILRVSLKEEKSGITVLMENDTEHLDAGEVDALFDRFYTADHSRSEGSTGLGLPIARYLAENMGGELTACVKVHGSRKWLQFYLKLNK